MVNGFADAEDYGYDFAKIALKAIEDKNKADILKFSAGIAYLFAKEKEKKDFFKD